MNRLKVVVALLAVLVMALPGAANATSPDATLFIRADASWVSTGVTVTAGDNLAVVAHGQAITGPLSQFPGARSGPDGQAVDCPDAGGPDGGCNLDVAPYGSLVAKIGEGGTPFLVGGSYDEVATTAGTLFLAINDNVGTPPEYHGDNAGGFAVQIRTD